ncbi:MAG: phenylalanine--tRNA ligase subunit beta, partial [Gemmatimonadota bacterium]
MNISYRWLRSLAPELSDSPDRIADRLAMYGAPVEEVRRVGEALGDLVIGRVARVREHPNADRLSLCDVDAGGEDLLQVVCGAPNVREGAFYPFIPVGGTLPGGVAIRKAKIRGETSRGMLCSERELGLGRDHTGILELRGEYSPGERYVDAVGLDDVRLTIEVTPNRPDLLSHLGVARELAPGGEAGVRLPAFPGDRAAPSAETAGRLAIERAERQGAAGGVAVRLEDPRGCPRYIGAVIRGVEVGPSPEWLASRLRAVGLAPINNVVDATNYVVHELGQPLHAFDLDRLAGGEVVVRRAEAGEAIVTLDGERRTLGEDMVVIADGEKPQAVAGVMGGEESEVGNETRDIFLECALFDPKSVRRTRRALGLATDASHRFERGVDPDGPERAVRRVVSLILTVAGGEPEGGAVDLCPEPEEAPVVALRPARASLLLGDHFDADAVVGHLEPLGFEPVGRDDEAVRFRVPGHRRHDVAREADLIEEVARRHGYDRFADELRPFRPSAVPEDPLMRLED